MADIRLEGVGLQLRKRRGRRRRGRIGEIRANARLKSFWALRGIDLTVEPGEAVAVVGARRSGRTSLLRVIAGTLIPDEGRVSVSRQVLPIVGLKRALVPSFSVRQNVHVMGGLLGLSRDEVAELLPSIVEFAGLTGSVDRNLSSLPGLVRPRLAFAIATAIDYPIVLIDDSLTVGGRDFEEQCRSRLQAMRDEGRTFVIASDSFREMRDFCDRAVAMADGRLEGEGTVDDMIRRLRGGRRD